MSIRENLKNSQHYFEQDIEWDEGNATLVTEHLCNYSSPFSKMEQPMENWHSLLSSWLLLPLEPLSIMSSQTLGESQPTYTVWEGAGQKVKER